MILIIFRKEWNFMEEIIYGWKDTGITMDRIRRESGFCMPVKHLHYEYEIYYLTEGERYYFIDNQTYHVKKGGLVLIDKNQIHQTSQAGNGPHERILVGLEEEALAPLFQATGEMCLDRLFQDHWGVVQLSPEDQTAAEAVFAQMAEEFEHRQTGFRLVILSLLSSLLIRILRPLKAQAPALSPLSAAPRHRKVDEVASYISSHYEEPLSLESLSEQFFVSKCYLSRIFKEATGFTVTEYLNMCRIKQARHLLISTDLSITEVAGAVGYDTITYFERVFKSCTLITPLKYRKRYENKLQPVR